MFEEVIKLNGNNEKRQMTVVIDISFYVNVRPVISKQTSVTIDKQVEIDSYDWRFDWK